MGGRGVIEETEAGGLNPALIPFTRGYQFRLTGVQNTPELGGSSVRVAILDNMPETAFPASILYAESGAGTDVTERDFLLNFGNLMQPRFSMGWGIGYRVLEQSIILDMAKNRSEIYPIGGFQYFFNPDFSFGGVAEPRSQGVGFGYIYQRMIRARLDVVREVAFSGFDTDQEPEPVSYGAVGAEAYLNEWLVLRFGYQGNTDFGGATWGVGFVGPRLRLAYAQAPSVVGAESENAHWLDLSFPVW